jgi:lipopolysaccharide/colanic/teichoic acid biosynthesis glycosyltransferase
VIAKTEEMLHVAKEMTRLSGYTGSELLEFIAPQLESRNERSEILKIDDLANLTKYPDHSLDNLINLQRVNDIRGINSFFRKVNEKIGHGGTFIGCVETLEQRRSRLFKKFPRGINAVYYFFDFIFKRVFPKFKYSKKFYFFLTNGRNRALSKSEVLGRLAYCGFRISDVAEINNMLYFKAVKHKEPLSEPEPSTGLILRINRIGRKGKPITVYKFRTMHPYAQYIQDYVFEQNSLQSGGKFANDFRITKWGRWMRKFWIDEIPMIYNIIRGDLKLVGVRPLSEHYLSLYTPEHKDLRVVGKPGLIPPFYADMPESLEEIMESESRYIKAYTRDPFTTDLTYCWRAFQNIFLNKARSH